MQFTLLVTLCLFAVAYCESELNIEDNGKYNFKYSLEDDGAHKREESAESDGTVSGSYSYVDPNGDLRTVQYKAGPGIGYQASGDISVDKKTAEKAAELAALAPKAPEVPETEVKIPASPFTLPLYHAPLAYHAPFAYHAPAVPAPLPYAWSLPAAHHPLSYAHRYWF